MQSTSICLATEPSIRCACTGFPLYFSFTYLSTLPTTLRLVYDIFIHTTGITAAFRLFNSLALKFVECGILGTR
jgi:hypothetical protein